MARILIPGQTVADLEPYVEDRLIQRLTTQGVRFTPPSSRVAALARATIKGAESIKSFSGGTKLPTENGVKYVLQTVVPRGRRQEPVQRQLSLAPADGGAEMTVGKVSWDKLRFGSIKHKRIVFPVIVIACALPAILLFLAISLVALPLFIIVLIPMMGLSYLSYRLFRARQRRQERMLETAIVDVVKADWPGTQVTA